MAKRKNRKVTVKETQKMRSTLTANRKYKDTVFRMLFSDRKNLLSLYNAINGTSYENPDDLEIVTLENAIYMGMKNDLAFIIDTNLFLYEHQSTYNPNMPLRDLFYISSEYQKLVDNKSLYSSIQQKVPAPNFIVLYNGTGKKEDCWINYLSDAYENLTGEPNLELRVITLNINEGHNKELMEQCRTLREYAQYVAKVREFARTAELNVAVEQAVNDCIQNNILAEFLRRNKSEVIAMSIFEYDKEEEERKLRKAEYEAGVKATVETGIKNMLNSGKYSMEEIAEVFQVSMKDVKQIKNKSEVAAMSIFEHDKEEEKKKLRKVEYEAGKQDGLELGLMRGKEAIIRNMFHAGETIEKIARYTGYKEDELKEMLKESAGK